MKKVWKKTSITYGLAADDEQSVKVTVQNVIEGVTAEQVQTFGGVLASVSGYHLVNATVNDSHVYTY
ncbi:DUF1659 domain-containing protein [Levilactobacillus bambusae]|uniref:DUF1659 domain-containing protein n=1 Tax=Levilactobacillus bambusae TaxID=2024736 RepID=A0A2V1MY60_9LACO|nr:hypothetical protein [Levilactobacillus bambusae]PWF99761.1 hypothetical protein DCM90_06785 [Levilactobacillus bambusae]